MLSDATSRRDRSTRRSAPSSSAARSPLAASRAPPDAAGLQRQGDVLGDGQIGKEGRLLVDRGDAERSRRPGSIVLDGLAVHVERRPESGTSAPGDDLDQGRLAGAVLADERMDFAGRRSKETRLRAPDAGERLGDGGRGQQHEGQAARYN